MKKKRKKACPKCHEPIYLVGNSVDESYRILTCKNNECEHYMRILKDKTAPSEGPAENPVDGEQTISPDE